MLLKRQLKCCNLVFVRYLKDVSNEPLKANAAYKQERLKKLQDFKFPGNFKTTTNIENFLDKYMFLDRGASLENEKGIQMAGRIHSIRSHGKNLAFLDLHQADFR